MISGSAVCTSFKSELLCGRHAFDDDDFYMALYTAAAPLDPDVTTHYVVDGEITAPGYTAGGQLLLMPQILGMARIAYITFDDPIWPNSSIVARGALIYNASYGNAAVCILDFGRDQRSNQGTFQVQLPPAGPLTALVRIA
jgi:hypothetical protein